MSVKDGADTLEICVPAVPLADAPRGAVKAGEPLPVSSVSQHRIGTLEQAVDVTTPSQPGKGSH